MFESSGSGHLETPAGTRHPVRYFVRSYVDPPERFFDSVGKIEPEDPEILLRLMTETPERHFTLLLNDGTRLPILLISVSGRVRVVGSPEPAVK